MERINKSHKIEIEEIKSNHKIELENYVTNSNLKYKEMLISKMNEIDKLNGQHEEEISELKKKLEKQSSLKTNEEIEKLKNHFEKIIKNNVKIEHKIRMMIIKMN